MMKKVSIILTVLLSGCMSHDKYLQKISKEYIDIKFNGKVIEKEYQPWNHGVHHLIIKDSTGFEYYINLSLDRVKSKRSGRSATWERLNVNYKVKKDSSSIDIFYTSKYDEKWRKTTVKY